MRRYQVTPLVKSLAAADVFPARYAGRREGDRDPRSGSHTALLLLCPLLRCINQDLLSISLTQEQAIESEMGICQEIKLKIDSGDCGSESHQHAFHG